RGEIFSHQLQQEFSIFAVGLLLPYSPSVNLSWVSNPQLETQLGQQPLEPACMPGGLHPHVGSFPFQIAVKLLRFSFAVVQLPFAIFTTFCIYERDLLKARVIIHPIMIMFGSFLPSLSRRTITVYSGQGADIVMQSSPGPLF